MSADLRSSVQSNYGFDPQEYAAELSVIEKFIKTSTDLVASGEVKVVISQHLQKFLT